MALSARLWPRLWQETAFTLLELEQLLRQARLRPVGLFFANADADRRARAAYRAAVAAGAAGGSPGRGGGASSEELEKVVKCEVDDDARQVNLRRWHALELQQPQLFGRMHVLYCQRRADDEGRDDDVEA